MLFQGLALDRIQTSLLDNEVLKKNIISLSSLKHTESTNFEILLGRCYILLSSGACLSIAMHTLAVLSAKTADIIFAQTPQAQQIQVAETLATQLCPDTLISDGVLLVNVILRLLQLSNSTTNDENVGSGRSLARKAVLGSVIHYTLRTVDSTEDQTSTLSLLCDVLLGHEDVLSLIVKHLTEILLAFAANLFIDIDEDMPSSEIPSHLIVSEVQQHSDEDGSSSHPVVHPDSCMKFLRQLLQKKVKNVFERQFADVLVMTISCVGVKSKVDSNAALDLSLAMINFENAQDLVLHDFNGMTQPAELIWSRIMSLILDVQGNNTMTKGLLLWHSLTSSHKKYFPPQSLLQSSEYERIIYGCLARGSAQQRKLGLAILRESLSLMYQDKDNKYFVANNDDLPQDWNRYFTIYETIIFGRYMNQVEACLPDLDLLVQSSKIDGTWIIALLTAALGPGMQDSIRKLAGNWCLDHHFVIQKAKTTCTSEFLTLSMLPWAAQGMHFRVRTSDDLNGLPTCQHGESLYTCIKHIIIDSRTASDKTALLRAVLEFIVSQGRKVFSFARAYILEGLLEAVSLTNTRLNRGHAEKVVEATASHGFQDVVRDIMFLQCAKLLAFTDVDVKATSQVIRIFDLERQLQEQLQNRNVELDIDEMAREYFAGHAETTPFHINTLHELRKFIDLSSCKCLQNQGLRAACEFVLHQYQDSRKASSISKSDLERVLSTIWDEIEVQEYPKAIIMQAAELFLHKESLRHCRADSSFLQMTQEIITKLQELSETRVYAFAPLARALRKAVFAESTARNLSLVDIMVRFCTHPPVTKPEFQLAAIMCQKIQKYLKIDAYSHYLGEPERSGFACVVDIFNNAPNSLIPELRQMMNHLLAPWVDQRPPYLVTSKWKTTMQLQAVVILSERTIHTMLDSEPSQFVDTLFGILAIEQIPRLRFLLEWTIARVLIRRPTISNNILQRLLKIDMANPKLVVSVIKLAVLLACSPTAEQVICEAVMNEIAALSANAKIVIRHEAQWSVPQLMDRARQENWTSITQNPAFESLDRYIRSLESYHVPPPGRIIEKFDGVRDHNLINLLLGDYLLIEPKESARLSKQDLQDICKATSTDTLSSATHSLPLGNSNRIVPENQARSLEEEDVNIKSSLKVVTVPLQTKWNPESILPGERRAYEVIVVASLVDNAYNLGGISRASEIFGASSMQVHDLRVIKHNDFESVAVSSENWLPIQQVAANEEAIRAYLDARKAEGYTVVGIEQTDSSRVLGADDCVFPSKTVLLLGSERKGIPAGLLADMDFCVEIRQRGLTRSLNVQTAAACVLHEYNVQMQRKEPHKSSNA